MERVLVQSQSVYRAYRGTRITDIFSDTHIQLDYICTTPWPNRKSPQSQSVTTIIATTSHHQRAPPGLNDDNTRVVCTRELQCYGSLCMVNKPEYNQFHRATNDNSGEQPRGKVAPNPACETVGRQGRRPLATGQFNRMIYSHKHKQVG